MKTFSQKLKEERTKIRMTLEELGNSIGSTKAYVWEMENRKGNSRPSAEKLLKIADTLQVSPDYLINDDLEEENIDLMDKAYFRKFLNLSETDKDTMRKLINIFSK